MGYVLGLALMAAGGALSSGIGFGSYEHFKNDDFKGGFTAGAKSGAILSLVLGGAAIAATAFLGDRVGNIFSTLQQQTSGIGMLQNSLGSPMYINGLGSPIYTSELGALIAEPVGALVASPVAGCHGCGY